MWAILAHRVEGRATYFLFTSCCLPRNWVLVPSYWIVFAANKKNPWQHHEGNLYSFLPGRDPWEHEGRMYAQFLVSRKFGISKRQVSPFFKKNKNKNIFLLFISRRSLTCRMSTATSCIIFGCPLPNLFFCIFFEVVLALTQLTGTWLSATRLTWECFCELSIQIWGCDSGNISSSFLIKQSEWLSVWGSLSSPFEVNDPKRSQ